MCTDLIKAYNYHNYKFHAQTNNTTTNNNNNNNNNNNKQEGKIKLS